MIPRRIEKHSILTPGKTLALLALGLVVLALWGAAHGLPLWTRALGALLVAAPGLYLVLGTLHGRPVTALCQASIRYLLRPRQRAWSRSGHTSTASPVRVLPDWWWRLAGLLPDRKVILAAAAAAICTLLGTALVGFGLSSEADQKPHVPSPTPVLRPSSLTPTSTPPPSPTTTPLPSPTPTSSPTPSPTSPPTPVRTPPPAPVLVHTAAAAHPGYMHLSSSASTPISVSLIFTGARSYRCALSLEGQGIVLLYPLYHPHVSQVQVWSQAPIDVQMLPHQFHSLPTSTTWWLPTGSPLGPYLKLRPLSPGQVTVKPPHGAVTPLAAGRWNNLQHRRGLYRIDGNAPFSLECGVYQW